MWIFMLEINVDHIVKNLYDRQGSHRPGKTGKVPWIWNFVPGREKARNFGLESLKLTCDRGNWFFKFCLTNKVLLTETQAFVCCLFSWNLQTCRVSTRKFWTQQIPVSYQLKQRPELTDGTRHYFAHVHGAEMRQPQNPTNMETLKLDKFYKMHLPTLVSDNNQYHNCLSHWHNLWYVKLQYKTDSWRWNKVPCYRPSNEKNNDHRTNDSFVSGLKTFDRYDWFLCQVYKTLIITLLMSHSSVISDWVFSS